jgi:hypothetical protein
VAVILAARVVFNGVVEDGVTVNGIAIVCPGESWTDAGRPATVRPASGVVERETVSATFPTARTVSVAGTVVPGVAPSAVGFEVSVTA